MGSLIQGQMVSIIIGFIASLVVQFLQKSPLPVFTSQTSSAVRATIAILSVLVAVVQASLQPGGLTHLDWQTLLTTLYNALMVIIGAVVAHYQFVRTEEATLATLQAQQKKQVTATLPKAS